MKSLYLLSIERFLRNCDTNLENIKYINPEKINKQAVLKQLYKFNCNYIIDDILYYLLNGTIPTFKIVKFRFILKTNLFIAYLIKYNYNHLLEFSDKNSVTYQNIIAWCNLDTDLILVLTVFDNIYCTKNGIIYDKNNDRFVNINYIKINTTIDLTKFSNIFSYIVYEYDNSFINENLFQRNNNLIKELEEKGIISERINLRQDFILE